MIVVCNEIHSPLNVIGTGYLHDAGERRDNDFDIGSRDFGDNFSPPDTMNSDEESGQSHDSHGNVGYESCDTPCDMK